MSLLPKMGEDNRLPSCSRLSFYFRPTAKLRTLPDCPAICFTCLASQVAQWERIHLPMLEIRVLSLSREDPLEEEMATHSSILAWEIPWPDEPAGLQSMGRKELDMTDQLSNNFPLR